MIASFVVAEATIKRILELAPTHVSLIVTGMHNGEEDLALAEYLQARLLQQPIDLTPLDFFRNSQFFSQHPSITLGTSGRK